MCCGSRAGASHSGGQRGGWRSLKPVPIPNATPHPHFDLRLDGFCSLQAGGRFGSENRVPENLIEDAVFIRHARAQGSLTAHDLGHGLAHEAEGPVDFLKGDFLVIEQILNRLADIALKRRGANSRMQQSSDIMAAHGEALDELENGDGFCSAEMQGGFAMLAADLLDCLDQWAICPLDVGYEGIIEHIAGCQGANLLVGEESESAPLPAHIDQHILNHLERGAKANATGGSRQTPEQFHEDAEMLGKERMELRENFGIEVRLGQLGAFELSGSAQPA